ncbi:hypothetical protein GCM10010136_22950 [Limoniibacter endophyticus]|uniref:Phosphotyrosine protein phosphatase I domain-containing protein n=1 Tax=Limoniibacter endophyticus TaxID=1565040 RepID=A0A8J3GIT9_9HYPH|nr:hypothetical protein GCM10010136_22950 [Limoniibacter endophyticus]
MRNMRAVAPVHAIEKISLLFSHPFTGASGRDVPDPYYGDANDFEAIYSLLRQACEDMALGWNWTSRDIAKG